MAAFSVISLQKDCLILGIKAMAHDVLFHLVSEKTQNSPMKCVIKTPYG